MIHEESRIGLLSLRPEEVTVFCNRYLAEVRSVADNYALVDFGWFDHLDDAMNWVANQPEAYTDFASVELYVEGHPTVMFAH